jgi:phosphotransferase system enzyme I (PtsP)
MAGDPAAALLLLGMGIDTLSMSVASLPRVKWAIRSFTRDQAHRLVVQALALDSEAPVRMIVNDALEQAGLGELVQIGKPNHGGTAPAAS